MALFVVSFGYQAAAFVNDNSFVGGDIKQKTDSDFVGENTVLEGNNYFAGDSFDQAVKQSTDAPFAQDHSKMPKDGVFIGQDIQNKTDGTFAVDSYGK